MRLTDLVTPLKPLEAMALLHVRDLMVVAVHEALFDRESRHKASPRLWHIPFLGNLTGILLVRHWVEDWLLRQARIPTFET